LGSEVAAPGKRISSSKNYVQKRKEARKAKGKKVKWALRIERKV